MKIGTAVKKRRSIREYKARKVPRPLLRKVLEAARWAPSVHNLQPWRFLVIESKAKDRLVDILKRPRRHELLFIRIILRESIKIIESAPTAILVYRMGVFADRIRIGGKFYYDNARTWEVQSVSCAIENLLLTAHSIGLGAAWLGIPIFRGKQINKLFGVKDELMAIITVGYPAGKPARTGRRPLSDIISFKV